MLSKETQRVLLRRFPDIKLSYNKNINRKVYADYYILIPKGQKAILWFTYLHKKNCCFLLKLDYKGNIRGIEQYAMCFNTELSYGTVVYGTFIRSGMKNIFCCEDLCYYKGKHIEKKTPYEKLGVLQEFFTREISQKTYGRHFLFPVLAYMSTDYNTIVKSITKMPYQVYGIKYMKKNFQVGIEKVKQENIKIAYLNITASVNQDIYNLYCIDNTDKEVYCGIAYISSYIKSVYMNKLFRTIKENENLDLLEESEDDEEFENIDEHKYVNLEKKLTFKCVYNNKFKKWEPCEVTDNINITTIREIELMENKV